MAKEYIEREAQYGTGGLTTVNFIEVHKDGRRHLINTKWIEEIHEVEPGRCKIYFAFSSSNSVGQDYLTVDETYDQLLNLIWR